MNCYVLIGGKSERMGRSKVEMFLDSIAAAAAPVFDRVIAVQRSGGAPGSIETIYEEPHGAAAPVYGVLRALDHAGAKCFVLATDLPLLTSDLLRNLRDAFERSGAPVLMTRSGGEIQPLCAGYSPVIVPLLEARVAAGQLDLHSLAEGGVIVDVAGEALTNVNTPEDAERLECGGLPPL